MQLLRPVLLLLMLMVRREHDVALLSQENMKIKERTDWDAMRLRMRTEN